MHLKHWDATAARNVRTQAFDNRLPASHSSIPSRLSKHYQGTLISCLLYSDTDCTLTFQALGQGVCKWQNIDGPCHSPEVLKLNPSAIPTLKNSKKHDASLSLSRIPNPDTAHCIPYLNATNLSRKHVGRRSLAEHSVPLTKNIRSDLFEFKPAKTLPITLW